LVAIPAEAVYITRANTPHLVLTKYEDPVCQESGSGPIGTTLVKRKPSSKLASEAALRMHEGVLSLAAFPSAPLSAEAARQTTQ